MATLATSLAALKTLNVQQEGLGHLKGALVQIQTQVDEAATSAAGALRPEDPDPGHEIASAVGRGETAVKVPAARAAGRDGDTQTYANLARSLAS